MQQQPQNPHSQIYFAMKLGVTTTGVRCGIAQGAYSVQTQHRAVRVEIQLLGRIEPGSWAFRQ